MRWEKAQNGGKGTNLRGFFEDYTGLKGRKCKAAIFATCKIFGAVLGVFERVPAGTAKKRRAAFKERLKEN